MDIYIGTKMIKAEPMNNHDFAKEKYGKEKLDNPLQDGYKVQYSDDYISWSPKDVFEKAYKKINSEFKIVEHDLITNDYTIIFKDENVFNAPYNYIIENAHNGNLLAGIHFQEGPLKENELNGIFMEDLIAICINRLDHFQDSEYKCYENEEARNCLIDSLKALRRRTESRKERNVLGTHEV